MVNYAHVEDGPEGARPEALGWQVIGRGNYQFNNLVALYGHEVFLKHNQAMPNWREVTEREFASMHEYTRFPLIATTYRRIEADEDSCKLGEPYEGHLFINSLGNGHMIHYDGLRLRARYFVFRFCIHDDVLQPESNLRKRVVKCHKCGLVRQFWNNES